MIWSKFETEIKNLLVNGDVDDFQDWGIIKENLMEPDTSNVDEQIKYILAGDPNKRWEKAMAQKYMWESKKPDSKLLGRHLIGVIYRIKRLESFMGQPVSALNNIVDIGGGYGEASLVFRALGFLGKYTFVSPPGLANLQNYYLLRVGSSRDIYWREVGDVVGGVDCAISFYYPDLDNEKTLSAINAIKPENLLLVFRDEKSTIASKLQYKYKKILDNKTDGHMILGKRT